MKVVTVVTDSSHKWLREVLAPSCRHHGVELDVLVSKRPVSVREGGSYRQKDNMLARYLDAADADELLLFTDGYDAMLLADEAEILEKYGRFDHPVVMSAETHLWPKVQWILDTYPDVPGPAKYLNCGGMLGRAEELRALVHRVIALPEDPRAPWSNQYRWHTLFIQERGPFALDHRSELFLAAAPSVEPDDYAEWGNPKQARSHVEYQQRVSERALAGFTMKDGRVELPHGSRPCHLHLNGVCSWHIQRDLTRIAPLLPWA